MEKTKLLTFRSVYNLSDFQLIHKGISIITVFHVYMFMFRWCFFYLLGNIKGKGWGKGIGLLQVYLIARLRGSVEL